MKQRDGSKSMNRVQQVKQRDASNSINRVQQVKQSGGSNSINRVQQVKQRDASNSSNSVVYECIVVCACNTDLHCRALSRPIRPCAAAKKKRTIRNTKSA